MLDTHKIWKSESMLLALQQFRGIHFEGLVVVIGGGPVGLLAALERKKNHNENVLVIEKRSQATRSQVVALREEMSTFLLELVNGVKESSDYTLINKLYNLHVRYNRFFGVIQTFQLAVLEKLLRELAKAYKISIKFGNVLAITPDKHVLYQPDSDSENVVNQPYQLAIDASGGYLQQYDGEFNNPNLHPVHGTFEFEPPREVWDALTHSPTMLEVSNDVFSSKYGKSVWPYNRASITRVFPFRDIEGVQKVYIGSEIPYFQSDDVSFVRWILEQYFIDKKIILGELHIEQTSTFKIPSLKFNSTAWNKEISTLQIGDAFYQPHYLTASGINNAYGQLTDIQLLRTMSYWNESLSRRRDEYYKKVDEVLSNPSSANHLFFQGEKPK